MVSKVNFPMYCSKDANANSFDASWIKLPGNIDFYLIFEFKEPWDRKIELSRHFPKDLNKYFKKIKDAGKRFKFLCVKPEITKLEKKNNKMKIWYYYKTDDYFSRFKKIELEIPSDRLLKCVQDLVNGEMERIKPFMIPSGNISNIFICNHILRDQCCGTFGKIILKQLKLFADKNANLRVWSSSHMGGHRVGPTFMEMPSGRFWGYVEPDDIEKILNQIEDHTLILKNYRGSMGLDRYSQIVEKKIFEQEGWKWLDFEKRSSISSKDNNGTHVKIEFQSDNESGYYQASVLEIGKIVLSDSGCGKGTTISKFRVDKLRKILNFDK